MAKSYYNRLTPGQMQGIITRPTAGLNEYNSPLEINDNYFSDCLDATPSHDEKFILYNTLSSDVLDTDFSGTGKVYEAIADKIPTDGSNTVFHDHLLLMVGEYAAVGADTYLDYLIDITITSGTKVSRAIDSYNFGKLGFHSMCLYFTEAKRYACYINSKVKKILYYDYTTVKTAVLPFYPKKIVSHANRVFALDIENKLWWCRSGDVTSWYGLEETDNYIVAEVDMANGTYTIAHQPDVPRVLTTTITSTSTADTLGTLTVVGTDVLGNAQTEVTTLTTGKMVWFKAFKTITSLTQAGHTIAAGADKIKVGVGAVGNGFVQADAGYATMEQERTLVNMGVLGNSLFIWSDVNTYELSGYSPETFSLVKRIVDIGCDRELAIANNTAYFIYADDVYEFDGNNYPRIISRSLTSNGAITNGILGGITPSYDSYFGLTTDKNYLYFYKNESFTSTLYNTAENEVIQLYYYMFDIKSRSWWRKSSFQSITTVATDYCAAIYVSQPNRTGVYSIFHFRQATNALTANAQWYVMQSTGENPIEKPYIVTKAFNTNPSEKSTLTNIIVQVESVVYPSTMTLNFYYSLTNDRDDFVLFHSESNRIFDGTVENININVGNTPISRAHHYRLKIEVTDFTAGNYCYFYNIERRFRTRGRSR